MPAATPRSSRRTAPHSLCWPSGPRGCRPKVRRPQGVPTERWTDIWRGQHDVAFVVAGAQREALLSDLRGAVDAAIVDGETLDAFRQRFDGIVGKHGWDHKGGRNWRSRVIYETNLRTSYAAGRYEQLQAAKGRRPYWRYRHSPASANPRDEHLRWDGLVLHADDPWWSTHFPPNGWGCKCYVESLNKRGLERLGKSGPDEAPATGMREAVVGGNGPAPRTVDVPEGIDPGFDYAPGQQASQREGKLVQEVREAGESYEQIVEESRHAAADQEAPDILSPAERTAVHWTTKDVSPISERLRDAPIKAIDPHSGLALTYNAALDKMDD